MTRWEDLLSHHLSETFPELSRKTARELLRFGNEVLRWNRTINLISRRDSEKVLIKLILDSLFLSKIVQDRGNFLDVGAGAGFPSIPFLLAHPMAGTLAEARQRRAAFLRHVLRMFGISHIQVLAQSVSPETTSLPGAVDYLWSKAAIPLRKLIACSDAWLREGGRLILIRPFHTPSEQNEALALAKAHRLVYEESPSFNLSELALVRTFVTFKKIGISKG